MKISPIKNRSTTTTHKWVDIMGRYVTTYCNRVSKKPNPKMGEWPSPDGKRCNEWPWQMNLRHRGMTYIYNFMGPWWIPRISWREHLKQNHHVSFVKSEPTHCIRRVLGVWNWHLHCLLHVLVTNTSLGHNLRHVHHHLLWESWSSWPRWQSFVSLDWFKGKS